MQVMYSTIKCMWFFWWSTENQPDSLEIESPLAKDIPFEQIKEFMEPEYEALQVFLDPSDFGFCGIRRQRTFIFLKHVDTCEFLTKYFWNQIVYLFKDFLHQKLEN